MTPDGKPVEVSERDFDRAMAAPEPDEPTAPAPPRKPADDGKPKVTRKRSAHDKPRAAKSSARVDRSINASSQPAESAAQAAQRRKDGVKGLVQIGAAGTALLGQTTGDKAWLADSVTLSASADPLATAVADTAAVDPRFAKAIDRMTAVGPYGALLTVGLSMSVQLAANHGVKAALSMGATDPDKLLADAMGEAA
jgi:hypothetical protein